MEHALTFFAACPLGVEDLLAGELRGLEALETREARAGCRFTGSLEAAYRACLWSRTASRVFLRLAEFESPSPRELYAGCAAVAWADHLSPDRTLAVDCSLSDSAITHSGYAAQVVKDAVVDQFRRRTGQRPSVRTVRPDIRLHLVLHRDQAILSLDLSGEGLHRRAWRVKGGEATLKENAAAALLLRAGWPEIAAGGGSLADPMCGTGTLPIEAALLAADIAPGLLRSYYGFTGWKGHDPALWERLLREARERRQNGLPRLPRLCGWDMDGRAVEAARANIRKAGLEGGVRVEQAELARAVPAEPLPPGLVAVNPPYGERMGEPRELRPLYRRLGDHLLTHYAGWKAAVLTSEEELSFAVGLRATRVNTLYNGSIRCRLAHFEVHPKRVLGGGRDEPRESLPSGPLEPGAGREMLVNRLKKNLKSLRRWADREGVSCYRVYDADLPEYAVAVDLYEHRWATVQEYAPPSIIPPEKARRRLQELMEVLPDLLGVEASNVHLKHRRRQRGSDQYLKMGSSGEFHPVRENGYRFLVNFTDYLDTGLFLDHRPTRRMIGELALGRSFLNLFAYTATASVYAAGGGALSTTSVDLSNTYIDWARRNLELNGLEGRYHRLVRAECLSWLRRDRDRYGLIFIDPPTFSNSKTTRGNFEVQRDHVELIRMAVEHLEPGGKLIFSNNYRRFRMDRPALADLSVQDATARTIPEDFRRTPRIHSCWIIQTSHNLPETP